MDAISPPSFVRALSPFNLGTASFSNAGDQAIAARVSRHESLQKAHTVEQVVGCIPDDYRSSLREALLETATTVKKLCTVHGVLKKYRGHQAAGTFPSFISKNQPSLQLTKEFAGSADGSAAQATLTAAHVEYCQQLLSNAIAAKEKEADFHESCLKPQRLYDAMAPIVLSRQDLLVARSKVPVFEKRDGQLTLARWEEDHAAVSLGASVLADCVVYAYRIRSVVEASSEIAVSKEKAKSKVKTDADVEMADSTAAGPSGIDKRRLQSMIDKAVGAKVKASKISKKVSALLLDIAWKLTVVPSGFLEENDQENFEREGCECGNVAHQKRRQNHCCQEKAWKIERSFRQEIRRAIQGQEVEGQEVELLALVFLTHAPIERFRYEFISTYPDILLILPYPSVLSYLILNTYIDVICTNQFMNIVHRSPDVSIPKNIEYQLSVGLKYMFPSKHNSKLFESAYNDFERRLKWRLFFDFSGEGNNKDYDPDYELSKVNRPPALPPKIPEYLNIGLNRGRDYVLRTEHYAQLNPVKDDSFAPSRKQIEKFLFDNQYVITMTDKNLGLAVSKREWIITNCLKLLNDKSNYKKLKLFSLECEPILDKQNDRMNYLADYVAKFYSGETQLSRFLRSKVFGQDEDGEAEYVVPRFYGIPKIHKEPVKMRPIIPCHSAVQNPAAKYCSKELKPLIQRAKSIIHGTKDLAIKLSQVRINPRKQYYIVTGDVVAFYPNIPIDLCLDIVSEMYVTYLNELNLPDNELNFKIELFNACLEVGNTELITKFQKEFFLQLKGLAMGVSDSPDLANLYGVYFEEKVNIMERPDIPFYGRYIDDCIAIVYASSEEDALHKLSIIKFDNCVIEWSASHWAQPFLDMKLFIDENNNLQHVPYRKARNHMERIPWISHHPLDVKRGTYLGELSRLATLCSQWEYYTDAVSALNGLYIARGYPSDLVYSWSKKNISERWSKRFSARGEAAEVLVLKSEYNTAWNYFNSNELCKIIFTYWREWLDRHDRGIPPTVVYPNDDTNYSDTSTDLLTNGVPDIRKLTVMNKRIIVSRKRTKNLLDLVGLWKNTVLAHMEEDHLNPID